MKETMKYAASLVDLIGSTPILDYPLTDKSSHLYLKLERCNPTSSYKDRMALSMVEAAERAGKLAPGGTIIESSSGNTADSLAMIAAIKGYKFIAVVDDFCSAVKTANIKAYGGSVIQIKAENGVPAIKERRETARQLAQDTPGGYWTSQADNPANPDGYKTLADELLQQIPDMDTLIGAVGTGGSLCGSVRALHRHGCKPFVVGVEPDGSILFSDDAHPYLQCGSGYPIGTPLPKNLDKQLIDYPVQVSDAAAFTTCNFLAKKLGLLVGGSSGSVVITALKFLADKPGKTAVALLADAGEKYLDTIFEETWTAQHHVHDDDTWEYLTRATVLTHI